MKRKANTQGAGWRLLRTCPACGQGEDRCRCRRAEAPQTGKVVVRLRLEKRRGRPVTVGEVQGLGSEEVRARVRELRSVCGTGGSASGDGFELQGDHRSRVRELLGERGWEVKG